MESYQVQPNRITWTTDLPDRNIRIDTMIPLALIINELISNAIKHGFPGQRKGHLNIRLTENDNRGWTFEVKDNGVGLAENFEFLNSDSLGLELVRMFSNRLGARMKYASNGGTCCTLSLPNLDLL